MTRVLAFAFAALSNSPTAAQPVTSSSTAKAAVVTSPTRQFPGTVEVDVDATDVDHRVLAVHERVPVVGGGIATLLFPKWSENHAPDGAVDRVAGLRIATGERQLAWSRDPDDAFVFRVATPPGVRTLDINYQILASLAPDQGSRLMSATMLDLQWPSVLLYPAGYPIADIPYRATVKLPSGWRTISSLEAAQQDDLATFPTIPMDVLVDSPVMAAKYLTTVNVSDGAHPVRFDLAADSREELDPPAGLEPGYRSLVAEAGQLFGGFPYGHYDMLAWGSGDFGPVYYEHRQSEETNLAVTALKAWAERPEVRGLFAHDYVHVWNGIYRRPAGMATATLNEPQQTGMLWMTEGLTEYWRKQLAVRAGLMIRQEYLDDLADLSARMSTSAGTRWRPLGDVAAAVILPVSNPAPWPDWQRDESDAYGQGQLIWMEVDGLIRERTGGRRSLDDFARAFFGPGLGAYPTYTLKDVVTALNAIAPYDWAGFFQARIDGIDATPELAALERAGYRLVFTNAPSLTQAAVEARRGAPILRYALGLTVDGKGEVLSVAWQGPAWRAGFVTGGEITEVNGAPFSAEAIRAAVRTEPGAPLTLTVKTGGGDRTYTMSSPGGLRYPHLERLGERRSFLDEALKPRLPDQRS